MKLRNKKTGEIIEKYPSRFVVNSGEQIRQYDSLAELNAEWEDYEEPKEHWCVTMYGGITRIKDDEEPIDDLIEIGNYFNDKESAYDALDKLKAWKRLKDRRFRFDGYHIPAGEIHFNIEIPKESLNEIVKDLELLFGGEE